MEKEFTTIIADMLKKFFNVKLSKSAMYFYDDIYYQTPALYFRLAEDETTENDYQLIAKAVDSFKGKLKWRFGRAYPSKINYEIVPETVRSIENKYSDKNDIPHAYKTITPESEFKKTCELAIADILLLYQHMKEYFEEHK